jgi:hypothetical protein
VTVLLTTLSLAILSFLLHNTAALESQTRCVLANLFFGSFTPQTLTLRAGIRLRYANGVEIRAQPNSFVGEVRITVAQIREQCVSMALPKHIERIGQFYTVRAERYLSSSNPEAFTLALPVRSDINPSQALELQTIMVAGLELQSYERTTDGGTTQWLEFYELPFNGLCQARLHSLLAEDYVIAPVLLRRDRI